MVWSQFSIKTFGVNFGNSVLDNFNWDKIIHSLIKKSHTCEEGGTHLRISFWRLLMIFEKPEKSDFRKNEKICWRYHHFTHVYQKPQSCEIQFLKCKVRQNFCHFGPFFAFLTPSTSTIHKSKILKKWKNYLEMSSF